MAESVWSEYGMLQDQCRSIQHFNISTNSGIRTLSFSGTNRDARESYARAKKFVTAPTLRLLPIEVNMNDDVPEAVQWNNQDEGAANRAEHISNLRNRARREFFRAEEKLSDFHREYLLSLVDEHPYTNHIYGE
jgi:hypothetical protein